MSKDIENLFKDKVLGHPAGLFVLFFTEMWERFSFYGMRVLLINFLTMAAIGYNPGWEWSAANAGALFGTYAGLLYLTPILGGVIADKLTGYRWAVVIGALIMTLGHASMAIETEASLYIGLGLLVIGTGFFKPNITSIISEMYKKSPEKKDGAYTIFYMGVNAGAFFGMMLCGYLAERIGWSWGFGLAGIFMLLGTIQFWLSKPLFGSIGAKPSEIREVEIANDLNGENPKENKDSEKEVNNPFSSLDKALIVICSIIGLGYLINDPLSKIGGIDLFPFSIGSLSGQTVMVLLGLGLFLKLAIGRILRYERVTRDRMFAFIIFAFFTVFFFVSFEQGASSLVIFARDNVNRLLSGGAATAFNVVNLLLTVIPLIIISYVLFLLWKKTFTKTPGANIVLVICFLGMWGVAAWMLNRDANSMAYEVKHDVVRVSAEARSFNASLDGKSKFDAAILSGTFLSIDPENSLKRTAIHVDSFQYLGKTLDRKSSKLEDEILNKEEQVKFDREFVDFIISIEDKTAVKLFYTENKKPLSIPFNNVFVETPVTGGLKVSESDIIAQKVVSINDPAKLEVGDEVSIIVKSNDGKDYGLLTSERLAIANARGDELQRDNGIVNATVTKIKDNEVEITVSWFSILNSFFIIAFASLFSKWWESKYNPSAATKYALGLIIMGIGFGLLAFGANGVEGGMKVSMIWLILAYLFHTLGELCLSPVGLSYVSKLVPAKMIALMFGMWYLAIAIGNKLAAVMGGEIENIQETYSLSTFFLIFTIVPILAGVLVYLLNPVLKKLMHGVK